MDVSAIVKLVGGLGMFLLGIHPLTEGIKDLAGDSLRRALTRLVAGRVSAIASGVVFTALIQSSTTDLLMSLDDLQAHQVAFVSLSEQLDLTSLAGRMMGGILAVFA